MKQVSFLAKPEERAAARRIAKRYASVVDALSSGFDRDQLDVEMDLIATHANGCPLDFAKLEAADDFNLLHDVAGIEKHLNRDTGELRDCFLPRCHLRESKAA